MPTQNTSSGRIGSLTRLQWLAVALVVITGVIHVYAGIIEGRIPVALAGVGYAGALVLFFFDYNLIAPEGITVHSRHCV